MDINKAKTLLEDAKNKRAIRLFKLKEQIKQEYFPEFNKKIEDACERCKTDTHVSSLFLINKFDLNDDDCLEVLEYISHEYRNLGFQTMIYTSSYDRFKHVSIEWK